MFNRKRIERLEKQLDEYQKRLDIIERLNTKTFYEEDCLYGVFLKADYKVSAIQLIDLLLNHLGINLKYTRRPASDTVSLIPTEKPDKKDGGKK